MELKEAFMAKTIYLIQHAEAEHHKNGMIGSWTDWPLTAKGRKQAENIAKNLYPYIKEKDFTLISSDLMRSIETLAPLAELLHQKPVIDPRIKEIGFGIACGKSREWFRQNAAKCPENADPEEHKSFPDAESFGDLHRRVSAFLQDILASEKENFVICGHGASLSRLYTAFLMLDPKKFELSGKAAGVSLLLQMNNGKRLIQFCNDMSFSVLCN